MEQATTIERVARLILEVTGTAREHYMYAMDGHCILNVLAHQKVALMPEGRQA